jgi:hypothetical protein
VVLDTKRRIFITGFVPGAILTGASITGFMSAAARAAIIPDQSQQQQQNPVLPGSPNHPILPAATPPPSNAQLRQNQRDIRKDVDQLFSLAQELKALADKNDAAQELSVGLIAKTEEIEKLAKKIRDLARS